VEKFKDGCYSLFKAKFIDNIAIVGGDTNPNITWRARSCSVLTKYQALLWVWLPLSWPSSSLLAALEKGWAIHHSMSDPWGSVHAGKMWKAL